MDKQVLVLLVGRKRRFGAAAVGNLPRNISTRTSNAVKPSSRSADDRCFYVVREGLREAHTNRYNPLPPPPGHKTNGRFCERHGTGTTREKRWKKSCLFQEKGKGAGKEDSVSIHLLPLAAFANCYYHSDALVFSA